MASQIDPKYSRRSAIVAGAATFAGSALLAKPGRARALEMPISPEPNSEPDQQSPPPSPGNRISATTQSSNGAPPPGLPGQDYTPVVTPNTGKIPWKIVDGVKVFHMVAEELWNEFAPGLRAQCWGYNGILHPVLEAVEGDRVRIYVTNRLAAATTIHWHGFTLPNGMDGVGGLTQRAIKPGETFMYEFPLVQHGTLMYHSHHDEMTQMGMGMTGMFVIHPRNPKGPRPDRDFSLMLHEWRIDPSATRPNPNEMTEFNVLTMNAKAFPGTYPLVVKTGQKVRIRIGNLGAMDHHPIHLHNYSFKIVETDGGAIPQSAQWPETTTLVAVGQTRTIEFIADNPGDWAMHCHMTHHVMNQMGHQFPNMIGVKPGDLDRKVGKLLPAYMTMGENGMAEMGEMGMPVPRNSIPMVGGAGAHDYITMGGMFTILKVRDGITSYDDPGWYKNPPGTLADVAAGDAMSRDGIDVNGPAPKVELGPSAPAAPGPAQVGMNMSGVAMNQPATPPATRASVLYTCVMHPEILSDKPGKCPKCGMKLVLKK